MHYDNGIEDTAAASTSSLAWTRWFPQAETWPRLCWLQETQTRVLGMLLCHRTQQHPSTFPNQHLHCPDCSSQRDPGAAQLAPHGSLSVHLQIAPVLPRRHPCSKSIRLHAVHNLTALLTKPLTVSAASIKTEKAVTVQPVGVRYSLMQTVI